MNAAEIQGRLRAGDHSFLGRLPRFGGGVLRGADAFWPDRSGDVDARLHYHVDQGNGVPTLVVTGRCAEFQWAELLDKLEERIFAASGDVLDINGKRLWADLPGFPGLLSTGSAVLPGEA